MTTSSIVSKSASMLDLICGSSRPLRFTEIVSRSGLPKSSAHRILTVLLDEGMLEYEESNKCYRPGPRIINWVSNVLNTSDLPSLAEGELIKLNHLTKSHVCLSIQKGDSILFLKTVDHIEPYRQAPRIGERSPIHCTAAGKAILANLGQSRRNNILDTIDLDRFTEHTIVSKNQFLKEMDNILEQGYASCDREEFLQVSGLAAPVFDHGANVVAAISIWNVESKQNFLTLLSFKNDLKQAACEISKRLGHNP